ncbi:hypothetical protein Tco_1471553 [Tanacetum coccineum]
MLDAFTSKMCADPWGRLGFARTLIEVSADKELKKEVILVVPNEEAKEKEVKDNGFPTVSNRRKKGKNHGNNQNKQAEGSDDNEVEEMIMEPDTRTSNRKGASTPSVDVNHVYICAILKSHVDISALSKVCSRVFRSWDWSSNVGLCDKGHRIIIVWNVDVVDLMVIAQSNQVMYVKNQKPRGGGGVFKKLDRVMGNIAFCDAFQAKLDEERFLKQKANIKWLDVGDSKSKYFHNSVKSQNQWCRVDIIRNENDEEFTGLNVAKAFVKHYECNTPKLRYAAEYSNWGATS